MEGNDRDLKRSAHSVPLTVPDNDSIVSYERLTMS